MDLCSCIETKVIRSPSESKFRLEVVMCVAVGILNGLVGSRGSCLALQAACHLEATAAELPQLCLPEARNACRSRNIWVLKVEATSVLCLDREIR